MLWRSGMQRSLQLLFFACCACYFRSSAGSGVDHMRDRWLNYSEQLKYNMTMSRVNRCNFLPRCLLFSCCTSSVLQLAESYFLQQHASKSPHFECMLREFNTINISDRNRSIIIHSKCDYEAPLHSYTMRMEHFNSTLTTSDVVDGLLALPPTPVNVYRKLRQRRLFKVLYLIQGDYHRNLDPVFAQITQDVLYLSFAVEQPGLSRRKCMTTSFVVPDQSHRIINNVSFFKVTCSTRTRLTRPGRWHYTSPRADWNWSAAGCTTTSSSWTTTRTGSATCATSKPFSTTGGQVCTPAPNSYSSN